MDRMKEVSRVVIEYNIIVLFPFYLIIRCNTLNFIIQLKTTFLSLSYPPNLIITHLLLTALPLFWLYCSYVLV